MLTAAQRAEIERKAHLGIPLTNPTAEAKIYYAAVRKKMQQPKQTIAQAHPGASAKATVTAATDRAKREAEKAAYTGWDNDPQVRSLQEKTWAVYVDTGKWNTADQKAWHDQAQKIRAYNNPTYKPSSMPNGPLDWMDAGKITPADTTPGANQIEGGIDKALDPSKFGSYAKVAALGIGAMFIMSMFRR